MKIIKIKALHWKYGERLILDNIDLEMERGKFYSIIGPNGSGKTTLLKSITKILEPQKDTIWIEDKDILDFKGKELARKLASVPQNTEINFDFSAEAIVMMGRTPHLKRFEMEKDKDAAIARESMMTTNTWQMRHENINNLSGGERQRVIVARALTQESDVLLLDEPIAHLDIHHQIKLLDSIKGLNTQKGLTVIAVLHDLNLAARFSDELILLSQGKISALGSVEEVLTKENIKNVYDMEVYMMKNPVTGKPHMIPI
ncbi:MAG: heme ABC transporter ATP-binding protein [Epulopiscium sp.]|nr:heme ABC transporter ATP-binding protein [Candidatus Epulonipiscium sp.]